MIRPIVFCSHSFPSVAVDGACTNASCVRRITAAELSIPAQVTHRDFYVEGCKTSHLEENNSCFTLEFPV